MTALPHWQQPDKDAFHAYLRDWTADNEVELLSAHADCLEPLPSEYARLLTLPVGSTYRDAVRLLTGSWTDTSHEA
jgi:hypothetical protein